MEMINRKTVELVISLQAEDAVRQNLEHVSAMLDEIASQLTTLSETGAPGGEEINWFVHEASAIQLRQVGEIQRRVEETGERVSTALRIMVEHLAGISSEAHTLTTSAAETTRRQVTVSRLDSALESLYNSFADAPINNDEIYGKMQAVQEMTNHIVALSKDLKMVSVNAQIRAAQLSEMQSIAALGKQAGLLSDENLQVAGNVSAGLNRLTGLMCRFGSGIAAVDAVQKSQQRELQLVSHTFTQELSEVNRRVSSELGAVCEQCSTLQQKTLQLLNKIRFIGTAGEGFGTISALIESIMRDTETCLSADQVSSQARSLLDRCRGKYTMKIEHLLHDGAVAESGAVASGGAGGGSEFGDNVELF
jgi:hypothetical protein